MLAGCSPRNSRNSQSAKVPSQEREQHCGVAADDIRAHTVYAAASAPADAIDPIETWK